MLCLFGSSSNSEMHLSMKLGLAVMGPEVISYQAPLGTLFMCSTAVLHGLMGLLFGSMGLL